MKKAHHRSYGVVGARDGDEDVDGDGCGRRVGDPDIPKDACVTIPRAHVNNKFYI